MRKTKPVMIIAMLLLTCTTAFRGGLYAREMHAFAVFPEEASAPAGLTIHSVRCFELAEKQGKYSLRLFLKEEGRAAFKAFTSARIGKKVKNILCGRVFATPTVMAAIDSEDLMFSNDLDRNAVSCLLKDMDAMRCEKQRQADIDPAEPREDAGSKGSRSQASPAKGKGK